MSEQNSTPDQTPTTPVAPTEQPAVLTQPATEAAQAAPVAAPAKSNNRRTAFIAGGAVLGALVLVGGGVAIGAVIADDEDDDRVAGLVSDQQENAGQRENAGSPSDASVESPSADDAATDDDATDDSSGSSNGQSGTVGAANADELDAIARAAASAAEGQPVTIEANSDGSWEVKLETADGSEAEVLVAADGTATVRETERADADDRAPVNVLDAATLQKIVAAALAEADGRVIDIDADDDPRSPFDVSILTGDRQIIEVTLDESGTVIHTEIDD